MSFRLARLHGRSVPRTRTYPYAAGSTFKKGALLVRDASGNWAECGADPASIGGVAEHHVGTDTDGFGGHGYKEFPQGFAMATLVQDEVSFLASYVGALPAAYGGLYGVILDATLGWSVDFAETVATRVRLVDRRTEAPENLALVEVVFLAANVQVQ